MSIQLKKEQLNRLFPFYIQINQELVITGCGASIKKISYIEAGVSFTEHFELIRPNATVINFASLLELNNQLVIIESKQAHRVKLRGQFELTNEGEYLFLGSPWISGVDEVRKLELHLSDFAFHDPLIDLLHVIKTMEIANEDIKEIVGIYNEQRIELKQALKGREEMAMFAMQSPSPIFRVDTKGNILLHNPASEQLTGTIYYKNEKLFYKDFAHRLVQDLLQDKKQGPIIIKTKKRHYSLLCILVEKEGYFNVYANDITEQQQLESEVARSTNRLNSLITNLQSGVLLENENRTIALVNQQFCTLFGIPATPEQLLGADCTEAAEQSKYLFKEPDSFVNRINYVLNKAKVVIGDKLELNDGRVFKRDFIPIWNQKEYLGHLWVYNDITQEESVKLKIESQRIFYEEILNNIPADIAVFDKNHRYLFINPKAVANPELRSWLIGKTDEDYMKFRKKPLRLAKKRSLFFKSLLESKQLKSFEEELTSAAGTKEYQLRNFYPVLDSNNNVTLVIGYGLNITKRKLIEDELRKAKLETEKTAKAKEQFVATMSHEIRTPLNGIIGITELLEKTKLTPHQQKQMQLLKSSEEQLMRIVNEVLEYERIINGHVYLEQIDFDAVQVIREIVTTFQSKTKEKKLQLTVGCNMNQCHVTSDPYRLRQVLVNLVSNALKFTQKGTIEVALHVRSINSSKALLHFTVSDTGIGIEKDRLPHLFDPYFQESAATSREFGGTGLGLAISQNLLKLYNSEIKVTSKPQKGSVFSFELELPVAQRPVQKEKSIADTGASQQNLKQSLRVLVAEDVAINQYVIEQILSSCNIQCKIVNNGKEALAALRTSAYDLVLMDVEMPVMGGMEATLRIRSWKNKKLSQIPIIAITANAFKESRQAYLKAGMNDCIVKPFTQEQVISVITAYTRFGKRPAPLTVHQQLPDKVYDLTYLKSLSNDPAFIQKTLQTFYTNSQEMIVQLEEAIRGKGNKKKVSTLLHKLKSSAGVAGMHATRKKIIQTEIHLKKNALNKQELENIRTIIDDFKNCVNEIKVYL